MQNKIPQPHDSGIQHAQDSGSHARFLHLLQGCCICHATSILALQLLHLPRGLIFICHTAFAFAHGFYTLLCGFLTRLQVTLPGHHIYVICTVYSQTQQNHM